MPDVRATHTDAVRFFGSTSPRELIRAYGSPLYVYNENVLRQRCRELKGLSHHPRFFVNYSAKANSNPALLRIVREEGLVTDAMSPGELYLNQMAGFAPEEILYVCNNVSAQELRHAVDNNVLVSVDSLAQVERYGQVNPGGQIMVRLNPGIGAGHHQKVITGGKETKFGVSPDALPELCQLLQRYQLRLTGLNQHIGSLFLEPEGYLQAVDFLLWFAENLDKALFANLQILDFGGGFGIPYRKYEQQSRLDLAELGCRFHARITEWSTQTGYAGRFFVEPGRYVAAECGVLLGTVQALKNNGETRYVGTDLGFNVLMRPMLYDAHHDIEVYRENGTPDCECIEQTVVGNICESGDILARNRPLPALREDDVLGVLDAGAYGFVMASTYNQRLRPAEVLIDAGGAPRLIRRRETVADLVSCLAES